MNPLIKLQTLIRAAWLLEREAETTKLSHMVNGKWGNEIEAKADYDEFLRVARNLRTMAGRKA